MFKKKTCIIVVQIVCFFFTTIVCYAQQQKILKGVVLETDNKGTIAPVIGALVFWQETNLGTTTNNNGVFEIPLSSKTNLLIVSATGFRSDTVIVSKQDYIRVLLISKTRLNEMVVAYERKSSEISFIDPLKVTTMGEKELFKAACCNLSESFETNPSVDVSYNDALTGTKQIQMLGLTGQYTQFTQNAIPSVRGLATNFGLNYLPGTWINAIQVSKGSGSVVNGYEAIAGQINTNLHMPDETEKLYLNSYASEGGRTEGNLILNNKIGEKFSVGVLGHYSNYALRMDRNNDGFLDNPLGSQYNAQIIFKFDNQKGLQIQGGIRALTDDKIGGQNNYSHQMYDTTANARVYGTRINAKRTDGWFKTGYVFKQKIYKSIGLQITASNQQFDNYFGKNLFNAQQQHFYANLIYQTIIKNTNHKVRFGLSTNNDFYREHFFNIFNLTGNRSEQTHGIFSEYTYTFTTKFTMVAGLRLDQFNFFDNDYNQYQQRKYFLTPRLHLRYAVSEKTVLRASAGTGWRTVNPVSDNAGNLISSRIWNFMPNYPHVSIMPYTFTSYNFVAATPEKAFNAGVNFTHDFKLNYRHGTFSTELYYTTFMQQWVTDREGSSEFLNIYFKENATRAINYQAQIDYSPARRLDIRISYRYYHVQTSFFSGILQAPLIATNRAFTNFVYKTKSKWEFDLTAQFIGQKRIPITSGNPDNIRFNNYSPSFFLVNTQITKTFKKYLAIYAGAENIFNFKQFNPILDAQNPFGKYFDASMIWGPVFGRMIYAGFRVKL